MTWYIGTSGWSYRNWNTQFYPKGLKAHEKLGYYSRHFSAVEVNSSFYNLLARETYEQWRAQVPADFTFSVKLHRYLTQMKKLKIDDKACEQRDHFFEAVAGLGSQLGVILIQLPPSLKKDIPKLETFLEAMPTDYRYAIEFRNDSWFKEEVTEVLKKHNVAVVISHSPEWPYWIMPTADFIYARFHGKDELFTSPYADKDLKEWAATLQSLRPEDQKGWIFFNNTDQGHAVGNAKILERFLI
jgi:uncharacterized protein YecE (DUF72 family)